MSAKKWLALFGVLFSLLLGGLAGLVIYIDPFFHYHAPLKNWYYMINNERFQNDGIIRNFDYDTVVTGTSMTENFKISEVNRMWNCKAVKTTFSGASYKELNDNLEKAYSTGHKLKYVIRGIDLSHMTLPADCMRTDLGVFPDYLYNDYYYDDVQYLLNKDVLCGYIGRMVDHKFRGGKGGMTSFDVYANWNKRFKFGKEYIFGSRKEYKKPKFQKPFTEEDRRLVRETVNQNIIKLAQAHPETTFYYFISPYSMASWGVEWERGSLNKQLEIEAEAIKLMLECDNIKLFSFALNKGIVADLNNYKDYNHYGEHINSQILVCMRNNRWRLTKKNYQGYVNKRKEFLTNFDYNSLFAS